MTNATNRLRLLLKREPGIFSRQEEADLRALLDDHDELLTSMANVILVAARQGGEIATLMDGYMPSWRAQVAELDQRTAALADILSEAGAEQLPAAAAGPADFFQAGKTLHRGQAVHGGQKAGPSTTTPSRGPAVAEPMNPADVPDELMAAALAARWDLAYPEATARSILAAALPIHAQNLGEKLGKLTIPCYRHSARPGFDNECISCHRYSALIGARRLIEGRDRSAEAVRQLRADTKPAFLITTEDTLSQAAAEQLLADLEITPRPCPSCRETYCDDTPETTP